MSKQTPMSTIEHIGELRKRVISVLILFLVSMVAGFFCAEYVILYLQNQPVAEPIDWVVINLTDAFKVYIYFSVAVAVIITFPFVLYHVWAFVSPGLTSKEKKVTLSCIPGAFLLSLLGLSFGYFWLLPFVIQFMTGIAERVGAQELYGMVPYFRFMFTLVIPFAFIFQMPLLSTFFTRLGLISPSWLRKTRKYAYFGLFVLAAVITPPELLSHLLVTVPLFLLYELSILFSHLANKRNKE